MKGFYDNGFWKTTTKVSKRYSETLNILAKKVKLLPINEDSLPNIKYFNTNVALQFSYTPLVVAQDN